MDRGYKHLTQNGGVCSAINTTAVQVSAKGVECRLGITREERSPECDIVNNAAKCLISIVQVVTEAQFVRPSLKDIIGRQIAEVSTETTSENIIIRVFQNVDVIN